VSPHIPAEVDHVQADLPVLQLCRHIQRIQCSAEHPVQLGCDEHVPRLQRGEQCSALRPAQWRPVVEDGWKLNLAHCIRQGVMRPGSYVPGAMQWTLTRTGEVKVPRYR
jgi:hypothetical protein